MGDRGLSFPIEIGRNSGVDKSFRVEKETWCESLVFVDDARYELQLVGYLLPKHISPCCRPQVVVGDKVGSGTCGVDACRYS